MADSLRTVAMMVLSRATRNIVTNVEKITRKVVVVDCLSRGLSGSLGVFLLSISWDILPASVVSKPDESSTVILAPWGLVETWELGCIVAVEFAVSFQCSFRV